MALKVGSLPRPVPTGYGVDVEADTPLVIEVRDLTFTVRLYLACNPTLHTAKRMHACVRSVKQRMTHPTAIRIADDILASDDPLTFLNTVLRLYFLT